MGIHLKIFVWASNQSPKKSKKLKLQS